MICFINFTKFCEAEAESNMSIVFGEICNFVLNKFYLKYNLLSAELIHTLLYTRFGDIK